VFPSHAETSRSNQPRQRRTYALDLNDQRRRLRIRDVPESPSDMHAIPGFGQRRFGDVQEIEPRSSLPPRKSFHDVGGDRESRTPELTAEFVLLETRKCIQGNTMEFDKQIVCTLPGDQ
jgi:hypothetical protein